MSIFYAFSNQSVNLFIKILIVSLHLMYNGWVLYIYLGPMYKKVNCVNFLFIRGTLICNDCLELYMCFVSIIRLFLTI